MRRYAGKRSRREARRVEVLGVRRRPVLWSSPPTMRYGTSSTRSCSSSGTDPRYPKKGHREAYASEREDVRAIRRDLRLEEHAVERRVGGNRIRSFARMTGPRSTWTRHGSPSSMAITRLVFVRSWHLRACTRARDPRGSARYEAALGPESGPRLSSTNGRGVSVTKLDGERLRVVRPHSLRAARRRALSLSV